MEHTATAQGRSSLFTKDGLELPIPVSDTPVEDMDLDMAREQVVRLRERNFQLTYTMEGLVKEFDRNLGFLFTLPSMEQAKVLINYRN